MLNLYPWIQDVASSLMRGRANLPHALLLSGPPGLGKTEFGMWLAGMLICESPVALAPCGQCLQCQLFRSVSHPDLHVVAPENIFKNGDSLFARYAVRYSPEDKSRESRESTVIRIDQVRALIEACQKRPQSARCKVFLISPAEMLNINAANSLLKILEEPPADSVFVLVSHQPDRLPATIISRCVRVSVSIPDTKSARSWLTKKGVMPDVAAIALAQCGGAPLAAEALIETGFIEQRQALINDLDSLLNGSGDPVSCASRWKSLGARGCLTWFMGYLADLASILAGGSEQLLRNPDKVDQLQGLKNRLNLFQIMSFMRVVGVNRSLLNGSLDEQLILDETLIRWTELGGRKS